MPHCPNPEPYWSNVFWEKDWTLFVMGEETKYRPTSTIDWERLHTDQGLRYLNTIKTYKILENKVLGIHPIA